MRFFKVALENVSSKEVDIIAIGETAFKIDFPVLRVPQRKQDWSCGKSSLR